MPLTSDSTVLTATHLAIADLGDEAVLLDSESGNYFGLNEVAARILGLAQQKTTVDRVVDLLLEEYAVDRDQLTADVIAFVQELERNGLIIVD
jgi:hypothetical protein